MLELTVLIDGSILVQSCLFDPDDDLVSSEEYLVIPFDELSQTERDMVRIRFDNLVVEIIKVALADAKWGDCEAIDWLKTTGTAWMDALGANPDNFLSRICCLKRRAYRASENTVVYA